MKNMVLIVFKLKKSLYLMSCLINERARCGSIYDHRLSEHKDVGVKI